MTSNNTDQCPAHPGTLTKHEAQRLRTAAYHAARALPPAIGRLVARELGAAAEFGWAAPDGLAQLAAAEVLALPPRDDTPAPAPGVIKPHVTVKARA